MFQRYDSVLLNLIYILIAVSQTVFISIYISLVAIRSNTSAQFDISDLLPYYNDGRAEEIIRKREDARRGRTRQVK